MGRGDSAPGKRPISRPSPDRSSARARPIRYSARVIRCVLFDVGNVLLFFSHDRMCCQLAAVLDCDSEAVRERLFGSGLADEYDCGRISTDVVLANLAALAGGSFDAEAARMAAAEIFEPNLEILPVVEALSMQGTRLVLLSNTCEVHSHYYLNTFAVFSFFDGRVLSHEVGLRKPDPAIFRAALEEAGCGPEECFFVDDLTEHVAAARECGIDSVVFEGVAQLQAELGLRGVEVGAGHGTS